MCVQINYICAFLLNMEFKIFLFCVLVPTPVVSITPPITQIVSLPLELQCSGTTVRGITSRVDIVWISGGMELERMNGVSSTTMDDSLVYTHSYTIPQLNTTYDGRVIQCEVVINASSSVMATDSITLDVTGEYCMTLYLAVYMLLLYTQFPLLQSPYHHLVPYKELWWVVLKLSIVQ